MDEQSQHYREIRTLLEQLVASWPLDLPGTAFENAKVYLDFHCADCGAKLNMNDLVMVLEFEMLRLRTVDARKVPISDPICVRCYVRCATPVCYSFAFPNTSMASTDARCLPDARGTNIGALPAASEITHALTPLSPAGPWEEHRASLGFSSLLQTTQPTASTQPIRSQRTWWRYAGECLLIAAMLLIVLALGIALNRFPQRAHASTFARPTAPAASTTDALDVQPASRSLRVGRFYPIARSLVNNWLLPNRGAILPEYTARSSPGR